jgi:hypothetical protein
MFWTQMGWRISSNVWVIKVKAELQYRLIFHSMYVCMYVYIYIYIYITLRFHARLIMLRIYGSEYNCNSYKRILYCAIQFEFTVHMDSTVMCSSHSEKALNPSLLLEVTQRMLIVFTDVSGQLIDFIFKGQSVTFQNSKYSNKPRRKPQILIIV